MNKSGYVYLLINPSLEGLVKIGMTTREPEERLAELSSATGIPTPFMLIYKEFFNDCYQAEKIIHSILESKRLSTNREFFKIPVHDAIKIIQDVSKQGQGQINNNDDIEFNLHGDKDLLTLADDFFDQAEEHYYGLGDVLEDYSQALKLYQKAEKLGSINAYKRLGLMYFEGEGCKKDLSIAIDYLKKGASLGDRHCYAELGKLFLDERSFNKSNAEKCWGQYFENVNPFKKHQDDNDYIADYIYLSLENNIEINVHEKLRSLKDGLVTAYNYRINKHKDEYPYLAKRYRVIVNFLERI